jgi:hypothetical protein
MYMYVCVHQPIIRMAPRLDGRKLAEAALLVSVACLE